MHVLVIFDFPAPELPDSLFPLIFVLISLVHFLVLNYLYTVIIQQPENSFTICLHYNNNTEL